MKRRFSIVGRVRGAGFGGASSPMRALLLFAYLMMICLPMAHDAHTGPLIPLGPETPPTLSLKVDRTCLTIDDLAPSGPAGTDSLNITVTTDNPTGYRTTLSTDSDCETCLMSASDRASAPPAPVFSCATADYVIGSVAGSLNLDPANYVSNLSKLGVNQWGAAVTTPTSADPSEDKVWFQVPDNTNPSVIKHSAVATADVGETQTLTVGAKVDYTLPADEYQNTIVITAVANHAPPAPVIQSVSPVNGPVAGGTRLKIAGSNFGTAYQVFIDLDGDGEQDAGEECRNANIDSESQISCDTFAVTEARAGSAYDVVVKTWGGTTKSATPTTKDDFTYFPPINPAVCRNADLTSGCVVDLDAAMIPVKYTGTTSAPEWKIADLTKTGDWYDYQQKQWANVVTVKASGTKTRAWYQSAAAGTVVNPADVLSYYVYIPRYRYQIWTTGWSATNYPKAVKLTFEDCRSNGASCQASGYSKATVAQVAANLSTAVGKWLTHPAFTFNNHELNGVWVGKYENTNSVTVPRSMPDATQVTAKMISAMFDGARNVTAASNEQGLSAATTDGRIFNNNYWGAVVYLSQSIYGVCTNNNCSVSGNAITTMSPAAGEVQKIWNNATGFCGSPGGEGRTGYGANGRYDNCIGHTFNASNIWYSSNGRLASSNHHPSGVYDLAGGVWEYSLDNYGGNGTAAAFTAGSSGFNSFNSKYMTQYWSTGFTNSASDLYNGKYDLTATFTAAVGQAMFEVGGGASATGGWNGDYSSTVTPSAPWLVRSGQSYSKVTAGAFSTYQYHGGTTLSGVSLTYIGSRLLLSRP